MKKCSKPIFLTALVLPFSLLTACGGGGGSASSGIESNKELSAGEKGLMVETAKSLISGEKDETVTTDDTDAIGVTEATDTQINVASINASDFEGHYVQKCVSFNKSNKTVTISDGKMVHETNFYNDKRCTELSGKNVKISTLAFLEDTTMTDNGEAIQVDKTNVSVHVREQLIDSNAYTLEDIFLLEGKNLYFGKQLDERGKAIEGRPTQISYAFPYVRKK